MYTLTGRILTYFTLTIFFMSFYSSAEAATRFNPIGYKKPKKTVCLNMIVKDEAHVITRCLESTLPFIDYWVIVDTGSTDGTQKIIRDFMKEQNIPGELHESPWVNFSHNRGEALQLAKFKADYVLFMDADDILTFAPGFKLPPLEHDCYLIMARAGMTEYALTRFIKSSLDWRWQGALHEYVFSEQAKQGVLLKGIEYIYLGDGSRSKDPEKYLKDAKILLDALEKEPDNARYVFYLGQTYASGHDLENALKYYNLRAEMQGWDQEAFWAKKQIAHIKMQLGYDRKDVEDAFVEALKSRPNRVEPYYYLAVMARENKEYQKANDISNQGLKLEMTNDTLFTERWTYDGLLLEYAISSSALGNLHESLKALDKLVKKTNLVPHIKICAEQNRLYITEKLASDKALEAIDALFNEDKG